jgi:hypothetical protein
MSGFHSHIRSRVHELINAGEVQSKIKQFSSAYSKILVDPSGEGVQEVTPFHAAFLDVMNDYHMILAEKIKEPLVQAFCEMYRNSEDEAERNLVPEEELVMHRIQLPAETGSDEWQLMYEMKSDDTIFHAQFKGWDFDSVSITH